MDVFELDDAVLDVLDLVLAGVNFPATRDAIVAVAQRRGADRSLIARLHNLPAGFYQDRANLRQMMVLLAPDSARSDEAQR